MTARRAGRATGEPVESDGKGPHVIAFYHPDITKTFFVGPFESGADAVAYAKTSYIHFFVIKLHPPLLDSDVEVELARMRAS